MMIYNPNVDLVNDNVYTKFGLNKSIHSQDIEQVAQRATMLTWEPLYKARKNG